MSRTLKTFYLFVIRLWNEFHSFFTSGLSLCNYCCLFHLFGTDPLCGSTGVSRHAVAGSAASLSELLLLLEEWAAIAVPKLFTQVCHEAYNQKTADIWLAVFCTQNPCCFFVCCIIIYFILLPTEKL